LIQFGEPENRPLIPAVTAVRFWSGEYFIQEAKTPEPENKPYRLINIPFYYIGQMKDILDEVLSK
jgi:hypothetical protein